ncbi:MULTISPECIES: deoxyribodipyrimidine photo-lyase [Sphingobacterium]|uniref:deoxyribodipyrimidine photo-lyase n=1 Tax=Sphingobacterium TaxID=28453 RepID=UPI000B93EC6D|nr:MULTISPECIES: deoxyribodipyrimidine photo-lyase [Sphingobacterium]OYD47505.1 deoxyribodipyrimidine photolyase [Sphingobacterium cellulitidis]WFB62543.1 deoxyribodipyrimidine photo-lyase [Sphingobacterium sp. WM]
MSKKVVLVWFRNDLRLHDNEVLTEAITKSDLIIPVYCFDPRYFRKNKFQFNNTGIKRAQFLLESVLDLKEKLLSMGSDLMTFVGKPEDILPILCAKYEVSEVYHHREVASRETQISELVEAALWDNKINLRHFIGHTLFHKEDLPFPIKDIPDKFNIFRKKIERESSVRAPLVAPDKILSPQHLESTSLPSLLDLGYSDEEINQLGSQNFQGGEQNGIDKLQNLLDPSYDNFQNFSLVSPYIAIGSLSPIYVYHEMQNSSLSQNKKRFDRLMTMLLWRDYFRFMLKKYPNVFFKLNGIESEAKNSESINEELVMSWKTANTGESGIDEIIQNLLDTGNITYAERRLISKYFTQELGSNWLAGASFFEEHLLDYAPATTYGFWSHMAAVGTSPKENSCADWQDLAKRLYVSK